MKKFTVEETRNAMRIAMKLKKEYSIKLRCKFNEISLSICLKEAYSSILAAKEKVVAVVKRIWTTFSQNEISEIKDGWNKFYNICKDFDYIVRLTGSCNNTHRINCSQDDFKTIKQMMIEV